MVLLNVVFFLEGYLFALKIKGRHLEENISQNRTKYFQSIDLVFYSILTYHDNQVLFVIMVYR